MCYNKKTLRKLQEKAITEHRIGEMNEHKQQDTKGFLQAVWQ